MLGPTALCNVCLTALAFPRLVATGRLGKDLGHMFHILPPLPWISGYFPGRPRSRHPNMTCNSISNREGSATFVSFLGNTKVKQSDFPKESMAYLQIVSLEVHEPKPGRKSFPLLPGFKDFLLRFLAMELLGHSLAERSHSPRGCPGRTNLCVRARGGRAGWPRSEQERSPGKQTEQTDLPVNGPTCKTSKRKKGHPSRGCQFALALGFAGGNFHL